MKKQILLVTRSLWILLLALYVSDVHPEAESVDCKALRRTSYVECKVNALQSEDSSGVATCVLGLNTLALLCIGSYLSKSAYRLNPWVNYYLARWEQRVAVTGIVSTLLMGTIFLYRVATATTSCRDQKMREAHC
jgi:hypothetical protein